MARQKEMDGQISMFSLLDEWETPELPIPERNKGVKAWVIEVAGITNSLKNNAPIRFWLVRPRQVMFTNNARRDPKAYSGWFTAAESVRGQYFGWYGGIGKKHVFIREPTWNDMVKYTREQKDYVAGTDIRPW